MKKILSFHNFKILIKSVINYYYNIFSEKFLIKISLIDDIFE